MQSPRSRRLGNGPEITGRATHIQYEQDENDFPVARYFEDPDGQRWISKNVGGHYTAWRFTDKACPVRAAA